MNSTFFSDDILPLNKTIEIYIMTIIARSVFHEKKKILSTRFFRRMLIQIIECYLMIELTFLKELMLTKQAQCDICHYWYFLNYSFKFQQNVCNRCHDLLMMSMNVSDIAILNIKGSDYRCIISLISKNKAISLMPHADLTKKIGAL